MHIQTVKIVYCYCVLLREDISSQAPKHWLSIHSALLITLLPELYILQVLHK